MQYIGTKIINAEPMTRLLYNSFRGWTLPADENGEDDGYLVEYLDGGKANVPTHKGYVSWSPKEQFDAAYRATDGFSFGLALEALKKGQQVTRQGWNGKGLWVQLADSTSDFYLPYLQLVYPVNSHAYPKGAYVPWAPSQTDVLTDDWRIRTPGTV